MVKWLGTLHRQPPEVEAELCELAEALKEIRSRADTEVKPQLPPSGGAMSNESIIGYLSGSREDERILERIRSFEQELERQRKKFDLLIEVSFGEETSMKLKQKLDPGGYIVGRDVRGAWGAFTHELDRAQSDVEYVLKRLPYFQVLEESTTATNSGTETRMAIDKRKVFVVHGRDTTLIRDLFTLLRAGGLDPVEFGRAVADAGGSSKYIGDIIQHAMSTAQAVVVLFSGDEEAALRTDLAAGGDDERGLQPRPNVIFEAGLALGQYPDRTIIVSVGKLRPISDLDGRHVVRLDNSPERRNELLQRLDAAGCAVDMRGNDWLSAGDFAR